MVVDIFAAINNKNFSPLYKTGMAFKYMCQYFYKRKHTWNEINAAENDPMNVMRERIAKTLQEKFLVMNQEKVVKFKETLAKETEKLLIAAKAMAFPSRPKDYNPLFNEYQERFFKELEAANLQIFEKTTQKYIDMMILLEKMGDKMDATRQRNMIE